MYKYCVSWLTAEGLPMSTTVEAKCIDDAMHLISLMKFSINDEIKVHKIVRRGLSDAQ